MNQKVKLLITVLIPLAIVFSPTPAGLSPAAWKLFAIYMAAILGLMLRPLPEPVVLLTVIAISSLWLNNIGPALAGYASTTTWLVFTAFMVGQAFSDTDWANVLLMC